MTFEVVKLYDLSARTMTAPFTHRLPLRTVKQMITRAWGFCRPLSALRPGTIHRHTTVVQPYQKYYLLFLVRINK